MNIQPMKSEDLRDLARDIVRGQVFCTNSPDRIRNSFAVILVFAELPDAEAKKIGAVWEYIAKAGPLSVNGDPSFTSCHFLHVQARLNK